MKNLTEIFTEEENEEGFFEKHVISNMPMVLLVFANIGIIAADYRGYDVLLALTGEPWKALLVVLFSCALPFVLWEFAWQYKYATEQWRKIALAMAFVAFATSIVYGVADYVLVNGKTVSSALLTGGGVVLTGIHTVFALLFFYNDPQVAMKRLQTQQIAKIANANKAAKLANSLLENARTVAANKDVLNNLYGEAEVEKLLAILNGKKPKKELEELEITNPTKGNGK